MSREGAVNPEYRLVLVAQEGVAMALVYPVNASPYSGPLGSFEVVPYQQLPRCQPGDRFTFERPLAGGEGVVARSPDGIVVRSSRPASVQEGLTFPLFAERTVSGMVHPDVAPRTTRQLAGGQGPLFVEDWEVHLNRERRGARRVLIGSVAAVAGCVALLLAAAVGSFGDRGTGAVVNLGSRGMAYGLIFAFISAATIRRAHRSLGAVEEARRQRAAPAVPMYLKLWWSVGDGHMPAPVAVAALAKRPDPGLGEVIGFQPVVNLRASVAIDDWAPVDVIGELRDGGSVIVRCNGLELWPARPTMTHLPTTWPCRSNRTNRTD
jgi:hypothetical protein